MLVDCFDRCFQHSQQCLFTAEAQRLQRQRRVERCRKVEKIERREEQWDYPGSKVRSHRVQSVGSSFPNHCPGDCYTPSRCAGECACASGEHGSPIARTSSYSSNLAATRWPTSRRPTSLRTLYISPITLPSIPTSGSHPGTSSGRANRGRSEERGSTSTCPLTRVSCKHESRSPGQPWTPSTKKTNGSWVMPPTATTASISASPLVAYWSAIVTASSPIPGGR